MRTYIGTLVALDAFGSIPGRDFHRYAPFFIFGSGLRPGSVIPVFESADREFVPVHGIHRFQDFRDEFRHILPRLGLFIRQIGPGFRIMDFHGTADAPVHCCIVHVHDLFPFAAVALQSSFFHILHCLIIRDDPGNVEESRLEDGIGPIAQPQFCRNGYGIDHVETDVFLGNGTAHGSRQMGIQFLYRFPVTGQEEAAFRLQVADQVIGLYIRLVVAGHEISVAHQITAADGCIPEPEMALGDPAGLLAVIFEIGLDIFVRMVSDDLDGVFVGSHRPVRAQAPELAAVGTARDDVDFLPNSQGTMGHIIVDADGVVVGWSRLFHVFVHGHDLGRSGILAGQAEAAGIHRKIAAVFLQDGADIFIERFPGSSRFLGPVQYRHSFDGGRQSLQQILDRERPIQMDIQIAHFLSLLPQVINSFCRGFRHAAHADEDQLRFRIAVIIHTVVFFSGKGADFLHIAFYNGWQRIIIWIHSFPALEISICIQTRSPQQGPFRIQAPLPEFFQFLPVHQLGQILEIQHIDFLDLVTGPEPIEEMEKRHMAFDGGQMGHSPHVHAFLHAGRSQEGKTGLPAGHHIGMFCENGNVVGGHIPGSSMDHRRLQLPSDPVHGGDHEHHALTGGIAGGQAPGIQCPVHGGYCTGFALHFHQFHRLPKYILHSVGRPSVHMVGHGAGRSDRVDGCYLRKRIRGIGRSFIPVHGFLVCHLNSPFLMLVFQVTRDSK